MAVDINRLREFQKEIAELARKLSPEAYYEVIQDKILDYIFKHPTADISELNRALTQAFDPEFVKWLTQINRSYNDSLDLINDLYSDLGFDIQRDMPVIKRLEKINTLRLGNYRESTKKEIQKAVKTGIREKLSHKELTANISKISDKASAYGSVIAATQLKAYNRTAKHEKANIAGIFYYEYMGLLRETSRKFCKTMLGAVLHIDDINKITEAEVGPAYIAPCIIYCGGWNCRHDWEPDPTYKPGTSSGISVSERSGFKRAASLADAESFARESRIASVVTYSGLDLDIANRINETLFSIKQQYNLRALTNIVTTSHGNAWASANGNTLNLNVKSFFNAKQIEKMYNLSVENHVKTYSKELEKYKKLLELHPESRFYETAIKELEFSLRFKRYNVLYKGKEAEACVTHELGHVWQDQTTGMINRMLASGRFSEEEKQKLNREWTDIYKASVKNGDIYTVSGYAYTKANEFFAECFTMYNFKEKLPGRVIKFFENYIKGLKND
jgi:hypothetical protein